jgi:hypothetical protein
MSATAEDGPVRAADGTARGMDRPTLIFLHIGKTAGTSLRKILHRQFKTSEILRVETPWRNPERLRREETLDYFATLPERRRASARLIEGHLIFGIHELVPRPSTYITLLRNPVALVISQYNFVLRRPRHWLHERVVNEHMDLETYVRSGIALETDNSQIRALSGDRTTPFGGCTPAMLEQAKRNLEAHFSVVGLTERFDESLIFLKRAFGWSNVHYVRANVSPKKEPVAPKTLRAIEEQNALDLELYRWATERFDAAIADDPSLAEGFARFRRSNSMYRPWGHLTTTYPQAVYDRFSRKRRGRREAGNLQGPQSGNVQGPQS